MIPMPHHLRVHRVDKAYTNPEERWGIRALMTAIHSDTAHIFRVKETPTHLRFYIQLQRKEIARPLLRRQAIADARDGL